ncbi:MAG: putative RNase H-like nuclease (RuvC/YqgF family) [bacterium]|jgi:predicted RNase H-like nuclease (RuvC/YqgF family)
MSGSYNQFVRVRRDQVQEWQQSTHVVNQLYAEQNINRKHQQWLEQENRVLQQQNSTREQNVQKLNTHIQGLSSNLKEVAKNSQKQLNKQTKIFQEKLEQSSKKQKNYIDTKIQSLKDDFNHLEDQVDQRIENLTEDFQQTTSALNQAINQQGQQISQIFDSIQEKQDKAETIAKRWILGLEQELEYLEKITRLINIFSLMNGMIF